MVGSPRPPHTREGSSGIQVALQLLATVSGVTRVQVRPVARQACPSVPHVALDGAAWSAGQQLRGLVATASHCRPAAASLDGRSAHSCTMSGQVRVCGPRTGALQQASHVHQCTKAWPLEAYYSCPPPHLRNEPGRCRQLTLSASHACVSRAGGGAGVHASKQLSAWRLWTGTVGRRVYSCRKATRTAIRRCLALRCGTCH